jgi:LPS export ABC transporter protein LptC
MVQFRTTTKLTSLADAPRSPQRITPERQTRRPLLSGRAYNRCTAAGCRIRGADLRNVILMLLLGAAAVASWIYSMPEPEEAPRRTNGGDAALGYYLRGARLLGTDENGQVAYRILADRLEEQTDQERLLLERVRIEYRPANELPWVITAGTGSAPKDASQLDLGGGVELRSEPTDGSTPMCLSTQSLTFQPESSSVASDEATELCAGDWHLSAKRLRANLKDERLQLESDVHGKFAR